MIECTRRLEWDSAHRVLRHESKCAHLHGHRYVAEITCRADKLDDVGRVVDFGVVKDLVGSWIDREWDHGTLVNIEDAALWAWLDKHDQKRWSFAGEPTAENIAAALLVVARDLLDGDASGLRVVRVRIYETPNCYAEVVAL